jgi:hypothetical protein
MRFDRGWWQMIDGRPLCIVSSGGKEGVIDPNEQKEHFLSQGLLHVAGPLGEQFSANAALPNGENDDFEGYTDDADIHRLFDGIVEALDDGEFFEHELSPEELNVAPTA